VLNLAVPKDPSIEGQKAPEHVPEPVKVVNSPEEMINFRIRFPPPSEMAAQLLSEERAMSKGVFIAELVPIPSREMDWPLPQMVATTGAVEDIIVTNLILWLSVSQIKRNG
jgi:hypothetical protein